MTGTDRQPTTVHILGTHGVPANYGGFETAAEQVGLYLAKQGWRVLVYCQIEGSGPIETDIWNGLERVLVKEERESWVGTASFDLKTVRYLLQNYEAGDVCLTFGYNTGELNIAQKLKGIPNVINMDGMEWQRSRWGLFKQGILLTGERCAGAVGDVLIADHPHIALYLQRHFGKRRVQTIAYGAHEISQAPVEPVQALGLVPGEYATVICRPIPENSLEEIVRAFSTRERPCQLVVLGNFLDDDPYHQAVLAAAGPQVVFPGAIYDHDTLDALRFHARAYFHGHTVGGTNPSLVEAMGAGNPVIAQNNVYNRFVAGAGARFFDGVDDLATLLDLLLDDGDALGRMGSFSRDRYRAEYTWEHIGALYEESLFTALDRKASHGSHRRSKKS